MAADLGALLEDPVPFLADPNPEVRRLAVSMSEPEAAELVDRLGTMLIEDPDPAVRAQVAEILGTTGDAAVPLLERARRDEDPRVVEAVATAYGEIGDVQSVDWLIDQALRADEVTIAESAVASLGAIGDDRAKHVLLDLVQSGRPQVRRRAVVALTVFEGDEVEAAIREARNDRNPMVREVAEMVVGRSAPGD